MPVDRLPEFLDWFDARGRHATGLAVPAAAAPRRDGDAAVAGYPLRAGRDLRQRRLLGHRPRRPRRPDGPAQPRDRGEGAPSSTATSRSTPRRSTTARPSTGSTAAPTSPRVKGRYDPDDRLTDPLRQGGADDDDRHRRATIARGRRARWWRDGMPVRFTAYDGSTAGPPDAEHRPAPAQPSAGLSYLLTAPGRPRPGPRLRHRATSTSTGVHPGDPYDALRAAAGPPSFRRARRRPRCSAIAARPRAVATCGRPPPPPQEHLPRWRRTVEGLRHSMSRDAEVIPHHYDVSNRSTSWCSGPSMTYTCAVYPTAGRDARGGAGGEVRPGRPQARPPARASGCSTSAAAGAAWSATPRGSTACTALGVTLSREQAAWAQEAIDREGLGDLAEVRHLDYRDVVETGFDAISSIGLTEHIGVRNYPAYFAFLRDRLRPRAGCSTTASPGPHNRPHGDRRVHRPLRLPRRRADRLRHDHHRGRRTPASRCSTRRTSGVHYAMTLARLVPQPRRHWDDVRRRGRRGHRAGVGPLHGRLAARLRAQRDPAPPGAGDQDRRATGASGFPLRPSDVVPDAGSR